MGRWNSTCFFAGGPLTSAFAALGPGLRRGRGRGAAATLSPAPPPARILAPCRTRPEPLRPAPRWRLVRGPSGRRGPPWRRWSARPGCRPPRSINGRRGAAGGRRTWPKRRCGRLFSNPPSHPLSRAAHQGRRAVALANPPGSGRHAPAATHHPPRALRACKADRPPAAKVSSAHRERGPTERTRGRTGKTPTPSPSPAPTSWPRRLAARARRWRCRARDGSGRRRGR